MADLVADGDLDLVEQLFAVAADLLEVSLEEDTRVTSIGWCVGPASVRGVPM
jgi:hypothetical protein